MANEHQYELAPQVEQVAEAGETDQNVLEEFSIVELEERLEFEAWCDWDCQCPG